MMKEMLKAKNIKEWKIIRYLKPCKPSSLNDKMLGKVATGLTYPLSAPWRQSPVL